MRKTKGNADVKPKKSSRTTYNVVLRVTYCLFTSCWLAHNQLSRNLFSFSCNPSGQLCLSGPGNSSRTVNFFLTVFFSHTNLTVTQRNQTSLSTNWYPHRNAPALTSALWAKAGGGIFRAKRETPSQSVRWSSSHTLRERPHSPRLAQKAPAMGLEKSSFEIKIDSLRIKTRN